MASASLFSGVDSEQMIHFEKKYTGRFNMTPWLNICNEPNKFFASLHFHFQVIRQKEESENAVKCAKEKSFKMQPSKKNVTIKMKLTETVKAWRVEDEIMVNILHLV